MNLLSDDTVNRLSEQVANRFTKVNEQLFTAIATHIKEYGDLRGTELNDLDAMVRSGADLARIKQELAKATSRSVADIDTIYRQAARGAYEFTRPYWEASGKAYIPFEDNKLIQDTVDGIIKQTAGEMRNISQTTCIALHGRKGTSLHTMDEAYKSTVDDCITAVRMGLDYKSVINRATESFARQGLTSVQYESGLHRRLDTAIRQNVIDGVAQINQHMLDACGEQFGADGVELSVHLTCAPDHLPIQGRQFSADDFDNLQMQLDFQDVRGNRYDAIKRPIGQWNCRHIAFPIIIGVSEPAHTDEELEEIAEKCTARVVIDGKPYTVYQATQLMRKLETKIRRQKDALNFAELCGNREVINEERLKLTRLQAQYNSISRQADLKPQYGRTGVYGKVSGIPVLSRHFATGLRSVPRNLTAEEIEYLREDIRTICADESVFEFNKGSRTSFSDNHGKIYVKGDVLPDPYGYTARDKMSARAVLAHEYYGHYRMRGTKLPKGHWADEFRASFRAAMFAPGLSDEDRQLLMRDALDRAEGCGYTIKKKKIIEIIRRYLYGSTI